MTATPLRIAIVYPGDGEARRLATPQNNRFASLFAAFAARGIEAIPAVYDREQIEELKAELLSVDGVLVWVNPIDAGGHSRAPLDAMLRDVAGAGVFVSAHPDTILRLGTKDVLVETRALGWGSDCHRLDSLDQLRVELALRLRGGATRVLKQWRGHSGIGIWRVQGPREESPLRGDSLVQVRHAPRGSVEREMSFEAMVALMSPYFEAGGHMIDQDWQARLAEGMVRCYLVEGRVAGFGLQAVNALHPGPDGSFAEAPTPSARRYHPPDVPALQGLKERLESEWVPALRQTLGIASEQLPLLWDCDFLFGERPVEDPERYVLCEINVSSVAPFPDSAVEPLVDAAVARLELARTRSR